MANTETRTERSAVRNLTRLACLLSRRRRRGLGCHRIEADPSRQRLWTRLESVARLSSFIQTIRLGMLRAVRDIQRRQSARLMLTARLSPRSVGCLS